MTSPTPAALIAARARTAARLGIKRRYDMTNQAAHQTRLERTLGVRLAEDAVRQWPQSGERIDGRARIGEVEARFVGLRLGVGRRHALGDTIMVEWSTDYGDGRVYRNVSVAELRDGKAIRVTDYWGAPFPPASVAGGAGNAPGHATRRHLAGHRHPQGRLARRPPRGGWLVS
jgi:hypothetical protein